MRIILALSLLAAATVLYLPRGWASGTADAGFYEFLHRFHGHTCAGSLMGARLGFAAKAALAAAGGEGKFKAKVYLLACPVDGVQAAAGTTYGNRALEVED